MKEIIKQYHELHTDATPETDEILREAIRIIKRLNDKQCALLVKAFWYYMDHQEKTPEECANIIMEADKLSMEDSSKTEEECIKIAAERLGIPIHLHSEVSE